MGRTSSDRPVGKTTFTAFGQDHTDAKALEAVQAELQTMQQNLGKTRRQLVIAIERSVEEVPKDLQEVNELHNKAVLQAYFDEMHRKDEPPSLDDFKAKHAKDLLWDAKTLRRLTQTDLPNPNYYQNRAKRAGEVLQALQDKLLPREYEFCRSFARNDNKADRGDSRLKEAAIYRFAMENGIKICGLDPISDREKSSRLEVGKTAAGPASSGITVSTGKIDQTALEEMEYERIQGMADNACQTMSELAKAGGGCVVAINMGAAHLASLELAITDRKQMRAELRDSKVTMCVLVSDCEGEEAAQTKAKEHMRSSVSDMRGAFYRQLKSQVERLVSEIAATQNKLVARKFLASYLKDKTTEFLEKKVEDPASFAKELCALCPELKAAVGEVDFQAEIEVAKEDLADGSSTDISIALSECLQANDEAIKQLEAKAGAKLPKLQTLLQEAQEKLTKWEQQNEHKKKALEFASRVEGRIGQPPKGIYVALAGSSRAGYTQGVQALAKAAADEDGEEPSPDEFLPPSASAAAAEPANSLGDGDISESDCNRILILSQNSPRNEKTRH